MSFSLDYDCYYYPTYREVCANSVDPDQMSHYALCVQGLHYFTLTQQCLDESVCSTMALLKKIGQVLQRVESNHLVSQVCF